MERFTNNAETTLDGNIDNAVTSINVQDATLFPDDAQFRIIIDDELMLVTGGAGTTTWEVTRGAEGTTAAAHLDDSQVCQVLTAGALAQLKRDVFPLTAINGSVVRYNQATDSWESASEPFEFKGLVLTPATASLIEAEGALYYDSLLKAILVCTDV